MYKTLIMSSSVATTFITVNDFDKICRICLEEGKLYPIWRSLIGDLKVVSLLEYSLMSDIKNKLLPQNICDKCIDNVYKVYNFKMQCHNVETMLKNLLETTKNDDTTVDEEDIDEDSDFQSNVALVDLTLEPDENINIDESSNTTLTFKKQNTKTQTIILKCRRCVYRATNREDLFQHHKKYHTYFKCNICRKVILEKGFIQHMKSHRRSFKCEICFKTFYSLKDLQHHQLSHTEKRLESRHTYNIDDHENTHQTKNSVRPRLPVKHACSYCGRGFKNVYFFNTHVKSHTTEQADQSGKPEEPRDYICETCGRGFRRKSSLNDHRICHGDDSMAMSFLCSVCGKSFRTKAKLQSHNLVHTGEKPHTCYICDKAYSRSGSLIVHMRVHTGFKPYKCRFCPKAFINLNAWKLHVRRHTGEKPFVCTYCDKSFVSKEILKTHNRTHTGERPHGCKVCRKTFSRSNHRIRHEKMVHKEVELTDKGGTKAGAKASDLIGGEI